MKEDSKKGLFSSFLSVVEKIGNKIPDPMLLFIYLCIGVIVFSFIGAKVGFSAINPTSGELVETYNLLSKEGFIRMLTSAVSNYTGVSALGLVLVCMMGVGLCDASGLFTVTFRGLVDKSKGSDLKIITVFCFLCVMADCAGGTGFVVMPPLAAIVWSSMGRNPLAGMLTAYAAVSGAFASNLLVTSQDVLNLSFTQEAANLLDPELQLTPAMNWYFSAVSTIILTIVTVLICVKIVEPRLGKYRGNVTETAIETTQKEIVALRNAGISLIAYIIIVVALVMSGVLRTDGGSVLSSSSPFMKSLTLLIALMFAIPGVTFGFSSGRFTNFRDVSAALTQSMASMGNYVALIFFVGQFLNYFNWSNLGIILAVKGATALEASGLPSWAILVIFVLMSSILNLFIGSASNKWSVLSTVFVPMFMIMGYHPALIQMAYRIGDAVTNPLCPTFAYFGMLLATAQKYDEKAGFATLMSNMMPFTLAFCGYMIIQLLFWFFFNIPLGPGGPIHY